MSCRNVEEILEDYSKKHHSFSKKAKRLLWVAVATHGVGNFVMLYGATTDRLNDYMLYGYLPAQALAISILGTTFFYIRNSYKGRKNEMKNIFGWNEQDFKEYIITKHGVDESLRARMGYFLVGKFF